MTERRRKRRKVYNEPGHAHFLTYSCQGRRPLLTKDRTRRWVIEAIQSVRQVHDLELYAYVIMPEHVHLLIRPRRSPYDVSAILYDLKRPVAWKAKAWLKETGRQDWLRRLTVRQGKRQVFHFWLPGGGFDRNIWNDKPVRQICEYIEANPVRRGLVEKATDWLWSSARFRAGLDGCLLVPDRLPE